MASLSRKQSECAASTASRENVLRPFAYRIEGGDDRSMPWRDVQVVEPPAIASIFVRLIPPSYTRWPTSQGERHIRALKGTTVQITGLATKPLQSAVLHVEGVASAPARLGDHGRAFTAEFTLEKSGSYWFVLTDREGIEGGGDDRWEIHAIADAPPTVVIEQPTANLSVTARAVVPVRVAVKDDLAIRDIVLVFHCDDADTKNVQASQHSAPVGNDKAVTLWQADRDHPKSPPTGSAMPEADRRVVDYRWDLRGLDLKPGMQVA